LLNRFRSRKALFFCPKIIQKLFVITKARQHKQVCTVLCTQKTAQDTLLRGLSCWLKTSYMKSRFAKRKGLLRTNITIMQVKLQGSCKMR
jgi:hypothetical protein